MKSRYPRALLLLLFAVAPVHAQSNFPDHCPNQSPLPFADNHADLGSGETVNCQGTTEELNDVHIAFGAQADTQECNSVTAEISPHYSPASWNEIGHDEIWNSVTNKYRSDPAVDARLKSHPYRVTGQLFFDASHSVCACGVSHCSPVRASLWEIHPVYNIEVCKAGSLCDENSDADWLAFDTWRKSLVSLTKPRSPHSRTPQEPGTAVPRRHRAPAPTR